MATIQGGNNPGNLVEVDDEGKIQARAVSLSEQASKSLVGDTYNINTGLLTLTDDAETPLFIIKNVSEENPMVITRFFITFLSSTGGSGKVEAEVKRGVDGGTLLDEPKLDLSNFNFGSSKDPGAELRIGGTDLTATGGSKSIEFLFTGDNQRHLIAFDAIILPRGASATFFFTPPSGNTSIEVEAGANIYIDGDF